MIVIKGWCCFSQHLCRQGLEAIQLTYELDVLINEYCHDESMLPSGGMRRDGTFCPPEAKPLLKGRLHLRMANIGYSSEGKHIKTGKTVSLLYSHSLRINIMSICLVKQNVNIATYHPERYPEPCFPTQHL